MLETGSWRFPRERRVLDPGDDGPVVEADHELRPHPHAAAHALDDARDVGCLPARRHEVEHANDAVGRLVTISAKDGSYVRIYFENEEYGTKTITGLKCRDNATYREVKPLFEKFRRSLRQYADGAPDGK